MAILVPEIAIRNTLEALMKHTYDDLIAYRALGTVDYTTEDVDTTMGVTITVAGALNVAQEATIDTIAVTSALYGKSIKIGTPSAHYKLWFVQSEDVAQEIEKTSVDVLNLYVFLAGGETATELRDLIAAELALELRLTVTTPSATQVKIVCREVNQEQKSLLYQYLGDNAFGKVNYFDAMSALLVGRYTDGERTKFPIGLGFDFNERFMPMLNIILPSEEPSLKQVGTESAVYQRQDGAKSGGMIQGHSSMYNIVISSKNMNEVLIIYSYLKSVMLSGINQFSYRGFVGVELSGRDITMDMDLNPLNFYHRSIGLRFEYQNCIPNLTEHLPSTGINIDGTILP